MLAAFSTSDVCIYLRLFIHSVLHFSQRLAGERVFAHSSFHGCWRTSHFPPEVLLQAHCSVSAVLSFVFLCCLCWSNLALLMHLDHVQILQPSLSRSQPSCSSLPFEFPLHPPFLLSTLIQSKVNIFFIFLPTQIFPLTPFLTAISSFHFLPSPTLSWSLLLLFMLCASSSVLSVMQTLILTKFVWHSSPFCLKSLIQIMNCGHSAFPLCPAPFR